MKIGRIQLAVMEQTRAAVLEALQAGPRMVSDMAEEIGCSHHTINARLLELLDAGQVLHAKQTRKGCGGCYYLWHLPTISVEQAPHKPKRIPKPAPQPEATRPAPASGRADPFAALFGQVHRESA